MKFPIGTVVRLVNYEEDSGDGLVNGISGVVVGYRRGMTETYTEVAWDDNSDFDVFTPALHIDSELVEA